MAEIEIRPAISSDIPELLKFDHSCETTHVWQMNSGYANNQLEIHLSEIRLPRILRLMYPKKTAGMVDTWTKHTLFLVARSEERLVGYLVLDEDAEQQSAIVHDLVVDTPVRRQGIGSALVLASQEWLKKRGATRFFLEVPAKNHAGIELANKLHFEFSGYNDNHYNNRDIALYFVNILK